MALSRYGKDLGVAWSYQELPNLVEPPVTSKYMSTFSISRPFNTSIKKKHLSSVTKIAIGNDFVLGLQNRADICCKNLAPKLG
jgi:hypothetical protein